MPNFVYLRVAEMDLEAAECLLKNGFYPQAVFFVAQSVEKAVKSIGLWSKAIALEDTRKIGHEALRVFSKIFERFWLAIKSSQVASSILQAWSGVYVDQTYVRNEIKEIKEEDALRLSSDSRVLLNILESIENSFTNTTIGLNKATNDVKKLDNESNLESRRTQMRILNIARRLLRLESAYTCLSHLCRVFIPHVSKTRYPDNNWNLLQFYNSELPLINLLTDFIEAQRKALATIRDIFIDIPSY